jgi:nucleotide-binding universal stress UspA family protein
MPEQAFSLRKILVATDFSEHAAAALGRALSLAEHTEAEVTVAHVVTHVAAAVPGTSFEGHWRVPPAELHKAEHRLRREAAEHLEEWVAPYCRSGDRWRTETLVGVPFVELIRMVQRDGYGLVLAGTRGLTGFGRFLIGSTAERLVRKCPCPVWVVRPEHEWPLRSILVPVDYSMVNLRTLTWASHLASWAGCGLDVLHVFSLPDEDGETVIARLNGENPRRTARQFAAEELDRFVRQHTPAGVAVQQRLGVGIPWKVIGSVARRMDASMIVMGSVGRTGLPGFFIGNTAERVLRSCDRSILAIKPEGFVSPIHP